MGGLLFESRSGSFFASVQVTQLLPEYLTDDECAEMQHKDEAADLTASEKRLLKAAVDEEKRQRAKQRPVPRRK